LSVATIPPAAVKASHMARIAPRIVPMIRPMSPVCARGLWRATVVPAAPARGRGLAGRLACLAGTAPGRRKPAVDQSQRSPRAPPRRRTRAGCCPSRNRSRPNGMPLNVMRIPVSMAKFFVTRPHTGTFSWPRTPRPNQILRHGRQALAFRAGWYPVEEGPVYRLKVTVQVTEPEKACYTRGFGQHSSGRLVYRRPDPARPAGRAHPGAATVPSPSTCSSALEPAKGYRPVIKMTA
jgi:hypothetical protein